MINGFDFRKYIPVRFKKGENQVEMTGVGGVQNFVFPFGEQLSGKKHDDVSVQFQHNYLDEQFDVKTSVVGAGASVDASDSLCIASTSAEGEMAYISSIDPIRYRAGHSGFIDLTLSADLTNGGFIHGGGFDPSMQNGFCIEIGSNGMTFGFFKDGVKKGSDFNDGFDSVDTTGINLSNQNIYRIVFGYLGVKNPILYTTQNGLWYQLHEVQTEGKKDSTHVSTPVFPITVMAHDGAVVKSGSWNGGVIGNGSSVGNRGFHFPIELLTSGSAPLQGTAVMNSTDVKTIVAFRAKDVYQGKVNSVKARLIGYKFEVYIPSGNVFGEVEFQLISVNSFTGTFNPQDVDTVSSMMEYDHINGVGSGIVPTVGKVIAQELVTYVGSSKGGAVVDASLDAEKIGAFAYAGNIFAVIAKDSGGNNITAKALLVWEELF